MVRVAGGMGFAQCAMAARGAQSAIKLKRACATLVN
jgi:hypothetical protein